MSNKPKFIWAVDMLAEERANQLTTYRVLTKMANAADAVIEPVCVLTFEDLKVPKALFDGHNREYRLEAQSRLESWLKKLKNARLLPPMLLVQKGLSVSASVDKLLDYARESDAKVIGVGTTTRKGLERFFFGSFAETLSLKSEIPLLVVNAKTPSTMNIRKMIFATDFGEASRSAFETFLKQAKSLDAKVILYSKCEYILPQEGVPPLGLAIDIAHYMELDRDDRKKAGEAWLEMAKKAGVSAKFVIDTKLGTTSQTLLTVAKREKAGLIALASRSGPTAAALLGSVARNVIRRSPVPVWVIHPKKFAQEKSAVSRRVTSIRRPLERRGGLLVH